ncbi:hypothetical protein I6F28_26000 [Bradyrhizobium sp. NBAIM14]|nr:hypothetical protein [Bradyrhizobium sp. NBAIM14]
MSGGRFGKLLRKLSILRQNFMNDNGVSRVRIAIVTARNIASLTQSPFGSGLCQSS